jgi:hypothetical protein
MTGAMPNEMLKIDPIEHLDHSSNSSNWLLVIFDLR